MLTSSEPILPGGIQKSSYQTLRTEAMNSPDYAPRRFAYPAACKDADPERDAGQVRLLIADDHTIVREGVRQLVTQAGDIEVVGEAGDGSEVLTRMQADHVDVLLLDMDMPGIGGEDLIQRLLAHHPLLRILAFSGHDAPQTALRAIRAGAAGFLTKNCNHTTLVFAIRRLAAGGRFIDPHLAERLAFEATGSGEGPSHERLSSREYQIMCLLSEGRSINDIAAQLAISNRTVSTHKARLMEKMGFANNADLVRYVLCYRLTD